MKLLKHRAGKIRSKIRCGMTRWHADDRHEQCTKFLSFTDAGGRTHHEGLHSFEESLVLLLGVFSL